MKCKWKWILACLVLGPVLLSSGGCKNKAEVKCRPEAQQNGTMKEVCRSNKNIPDASVDGNRATSLAKTSYVIVELDGGLRLLDKTITFGVTVKTDRGFEKKAKIQALRSKQHEEAARLLLGGDHHYYAFVAEDARQFDAMLHEVQANTDKGASAEINYSFTYKAESGRTAPLTPDKVVFWEKVPGQDLQKVPAEFSRIGLPTLPIRK